MKSVIPFLLLLLGTGQTLAQEYMTCLVAQYKGASKKYRYVIERNYDVRGNLLSQIYQDYKESSTVTNVDGHWVYAYKDTFCISKTQISGDHFDLKTGDTVRTFYSYDPAGCLAREEVHTFKRHFRKDADFGFGSADGCIPGPEDYESKKSWKITGEVTYKYDAQGRKIEKKLNNDHYIWKYDSLGRLIELAKYDHHGSLSTVEAYSWKGNVYSMTKVAYNPGGSNAHYWDNYVWQHTVDKSGNVLERVLLIDGKIRNRETREYDNKGKLQQYVYYGENGKPEITHKYHYEIVGK